MTPSPHALCPRPAPETTRPHPCPAIPAGSCPALLLRGLLVEAPCSPGAGGPVILPPPLPRCPSPQGPPPCVGRDRSEGAGASLRLGGRCVVLCHSVTCQQELLFWGRRRFHACFFQLLPACSQLPERAPGQQRGHSCVSRGYGEARPPGRLRTWRSLGPSAAQWLPVLLVGTLATQVSIIAAFGLENKGVSKQSCG